MTKSQEKTQQHEAYTTHEKQNQNIVDEEIEANILRNKEGNEKQ